MEEKRALSASSIKTIETCTWLYWTQYVQKIPQKSNDGALRGTVVHLILELLLDPRHRHHYDSIMAENNIKGSPAIRRLTIKLLKQKRALNPTNYDLCNNMILVGLKTDFFGKGGVLGKPEFRFDIQNEDPEYRVRGYIDKMIFYDNGRVKIVDYKGSKNKFSGEDLDANVQSLVYSLVGYKVFKAEDVSAEFIFLRYPQKPIQAVHFTREQLSGFEHYLSHMYAFVNRFDEQQATSNLAANSGKNRWLCKAGAWECPYMRPFPYFALMNKEGKIERTAFQRKDLTANEDQTIVSLRYNGCPAYEGVSAVDEL